MPITNKQRLSKWTALWIELGLGDVEFKVVRETDHGPLPPSLIQISRSDKPDIPLAMLDIPNIQTMTKLIHFLQEMRSEMIAMSGERLKL